MLSQADRPTVYVIAGPNGAGKTTFASEFLPDFVRCQQFLNADLIAAGLSPFAPETQKKLFRRIEQQAEETREEGI
jgi:predicted ABC-type ATPase